MNLPTLKQLHAQALEESWAVPHFNFSSLAQLNGIVDALKKAKAPALLGTSEGERDFLGLDQVVALVETFQEDGLSVFLNADHSHSVETAKIAIDAGYKSIHIDLSKKPFEENMKGTREVVDYARDKDVEIEVEGELGYLVTDSSKIYDKKVEIPEESYTKIEEAVEFVEATRVHRFAPAIGNLHGIALNKPVIKFDLVEKLRNALPKDLTFVLHGGSGISDEDMKKLVRLGINNIHVSTELRVAYTDALREKLKENPDEVAPYKYLKDAREATAEIIKSKLEIFGAVGRVK